MSPWTRWLSLCPSKRVRWLLGLSCIAILSLAVAGCAATWQPPAQVGDSVLRGRASTANKQSVRLSAAVLSAEESRRMLGVDVNPKQVQTVWVEVQNATADTLWLLSSGTDPDYFAPLEVAWSMHRELSGDTNKRIDEQFDKLGFKNPIPPRQTHSGLLFVNPERGTRLLNVDLLRRKSLIPFTFFLNVPDDASDRRFIQKSFNYPVQQLKNYENLEDLRVALARLPRCAGDSRSGEQGDPLNAVFIGEFPDIGAAVVRRNYRRDPRAVDAAQYVFGREPDVVLRKESQGGAPATWVRGWLTPLRFKGQSIYVVQVGRPVGGRFVQKDAQVLLQENVDEARNLLIQDMMYSGGLESLGFVTGVGASSQEHPRTTFSGAHYYSDGLRAVMFFATRPLSLSEVHVLDWEPALERAGRNVRGEVDDASH